MIVGCDECSIGGYKNETSNTEDCLLCSEWMDLNMN